VARTSAPQRGIGAGLAALSLPSAPEKPTSACAVARNDRAYAQRSARAARRGCTSWRALATRQDLLADLAALALRHGWPSRRQAIGYRVRGGAERGAWRAFWARIVIIMATQRPVARCCWHARCPYTLRTRTYSPLHHAFHLCQRRSAPSALHVPLRLLYHCLAQPSFAAPIQRISCARRVAVRGNNHGAVTRNSITRVSHNCAGLPRARTARHQRAVTVRDAPLAQIMRALYCFTTRAYFHFASAFTGVAFV